LPIANAPAAQDSVTKRVPANAKVSAKTIIARRCSFVKDVKSPSPEVIPGET
jgi:hypothetical protein